MTDSGMPQLNPWFVDAPTFSGMCKVEFEDPSKNLEGDATITYQPTGTVSVKLEPSSEAPEPAFMRQLRFFVSAGFPHEATRLTVVGDGFTFESARKVMWTGFSGGTIEFQPLQSQLTLQTAAAPKYWVLPLTNFIHDLTARFTDLDTHPLRIYPIPSVVKTDEEEDVMALVRANSKNRLIGFRFNSGSGFIEGVPEYGSRVEELKAGRIRVAVTAVMVGEVNGKPTWPFESLWEWFPFDFTYLLSLATGHRVGAPWIEFRDAAGKLTSMVNISLTHASFESGRAAIPDQLINGIGQLLTQAEGSRHFRSSLLRVVLNHLIEAGMEGSLEDRMIHLVRSLEAIGKELMPGDGHLLKKLDATTAASVQALLEVSVKNVQTMARAKRKSSDTANAAVLETIAERIRNAGNKGDRFPLLISEIPHAFGLYDPEVLNPHCLSSTHFGNTAWTSLVAKFRNDVVHRAYFDIGKDPIERLYPIISHLNDMLLRVVLKMLTYDGLYQPPNCFGGDLQPLDWVQPGIDPRRLGF